MLHELLIRDLGVIADVSLLFEPGLTAVTGETGAGKTMIVGAIDLLVGGRADSSVVRPGATEAVVEGRFVVGENEHILRRVVPRNGRSRAYVDGALATAANLSELGAELVDLHGQHAHQSLLQTSAQRRALDTFGRVDRRPLVEARADLAAVNAALEDLGGDERSRARELDLLRFQVDELVAADFRDPGEESDLELAEDQLADAVAHREAASTAIAALTDEAMADNVAAALHSISGRTPFAELAVRLRSVAVELDELVAEIRSVGEGIEDDPEQLSNLRARRQLLVELKRKYGDTLGEVLEFQRQTTERLHELETHDQRAAELDARQVVALEKLAEAERAVRSAREIAAPELAKAMQANLADLAMANARIEISVTGTAGEEVSMLLSANPGAEPLPLSRIASGGELARTMLALRMVLSDAPPILVFDEVDAGIGGETAHTVGRALASLGSDHQVLVVTHLAQVAAYADHHFTVAKTDDGATTVTTVERLARDERVVELSRMLSGSPDSDAAHDHAQELLTSAGQ